MIRTLAALAALTGAAQAHDLNLAVRTVQVSMPDQTEIDQVSPCKPGEVATGGGVQLGAGGVSGAYITATKPFLDKAGKPIAWESIVTNTSGATLLTTFYAVCQH